MYEQPFIKGETLRVRPGLTSYKFGRGDRMPNPGEPVTVGYIMGESTFKCTEGWQWHVDDVERIDGSIPKRLYHGYETA